MTIYRGGAGTTIVADPNNIDGDKGDITVSGGGELWEVDAGVIETTNLGGDITTAGKALLDDADASAQRTTLGLGTVATTPITDYATAAQGTVADAALPRAGGAMTGAITTTSTFDGRDVSVDGTKLDGVEALADVTDATNVSSAGAQMTTGKDATGGYAGLTLFKLNLKNAANTFTNFFTNTTTAARTWTLPDKDGTVAMTVDITGTNSGTNTGDEVVAIATEVNTGTNDVKYLSPLALAGSALQTKVDAIEALADVTDVTNVTAAGALMDSEVTNLAQVKAFDTTDYVAKTSATGSAVMPTGTTAQQDVSPVAGYLRFNSTDTSFEGYNGTVWGAIGGSGSGNTTTNGLYEHANTISANYSITSGNNALTAGPITINTGISVTIPTGSTWVVA